MGSTVGILHPGQMGVVLAQSARMAGNRVFWCSDGRSLESRKRAEEAHLEDAQTLRGICEQVEILVSICPPEFAEALADQVLATGFRGTFMDANAIAPQKVRRMCERMTAAGVDFADGAVIGLPTLEPGKTWMHVSGPASRRIAAVFAGGPLTVHVLEGEAGKASALKMCYAGFNKGSIALVGAVAAAAHHFDVYPDLEKEWDRTGHSASRFQAQLVRAAPKAWRWVGEMREISQTLASAGVPGEFHLAAADLYERLRDMKDRDQPAFEDIIRRLNSLS